MSIKFKTSGHVSLDDGFGTCNFLGRGDLLGSLIELFGRERAARYCYSGLYRNGKSSLFGLVADFVNKSGTRTIAAMMDISQSDSQNSLMVNIMEVINEQVKCNKKLNLLPRTIDCTPMYQAFRESTTPFRQTQSMKAYLNYLREQGYAVVLFLDECQVLAANSRFTFEELNRVHSLPYISIVYIGRSYFDAVVQQMEGFPAGGVLPSCRQETIKGFDDNDIQLYVDVFLNQYEFDITEYMPLIKKYCGRSPFLYARVGELLQGELSKGRGYTITAKWFKDVSKLREFELYRLVNSTYILSREEMNGMTNLTRLQRIMIGPRVGIRRNDMAIMEQLGYIDHFGEEYFALTPSFVDWLRSLEITGELPNKMVFAERLLKQLIRSNAQEIITNVQVLSDLPDQTKGYFWSDLDKALLSMKLVTVPETLHDGRKYGSTYRLGCKPEVMDKYANWINSRMMDGNAGDLLDVLLLKDKLGILLSAWELFSPFSNEEKENWRSRLFVWCRSRNVTFHADILTDQDDRQCERCCNDVLQLLGPMFPYLK